MLLTIAVFAGPVVWMVANAFAAGPGGGVGYAFGELLRTTPVADWIATSMFVAGSQTLLAVVVCGLAGFALQAHRFRGRRIAIAVVAATALLPAPMAIIGLFQLTAAVGLIDSPWAVILPGAFSAFGVFVYVAAFRSVPRTVLEAGRLDGCGEWRLWWHVAMPSVQPATAAFVVLHFVAAWNALAWPAAVLASERRRTLPAGLSDLAATASFEAEPALLFAGVLLGIVPPVVLFLLAGRDVLGRASA